MKNIQVIDGAANCTFPIFQATEEEFRAIFPLPGQDLEFSEDLSARLGESEWVRIMSPLWERPVLKSQAQGIHGTLFFGFEGKRNHFPPSKRERDFDPSSLNAAQRRLYESG